ncbi:hypothetical protein E4U21_001831 [Claviceps maximensis]|nr:hypothetical protein E4U21_001831 [Claviceps maximensis]
MHHHRKKSGHGHHSTSTTDVRKSASSSDPSSKSKRPGTSRRTTSSSAQKSSRGHREREQDQYDTWQEEPESFPQYCTVCDQLLAPEVNGLYCSDTCRRVDQNSTSYASTMSTYYMGGNYSSYNNTNYEEPRDIVPRAVPSQPTSTHYDHSLPASQDTTSAGQYSSALSALRSLAISSTSGPSSGSNSGGIWPFSRSSATSSSESHRRPSVPCLSSTYDTSYQVNSRPYTYDAGSNGLDQPPPSRRSGASSRPTSTELLTPVVTRRAW